MTASPIPKGTVNRTLEEDQDMDELGSQHSLSYTQNINIQDIDDALSQSQRVITRRQRINSFAVNAKTTSNMFTNLWTKK